MTLKQLLDAIESVEKRIKVAQNLLKSLSERDGKEQCARISCLGSWEVGFQPHEVDELIMNRLEELQNHLAKLLAAKDAAEKTAFGWLNEPH